MESKINGFTGRSCVESWLPVVHLIRLYPWCVCVHMRVLVIEEAVGSLRVYSDMCHHATCYGRFLFVASNSRKASTIIGESPCLCTICVN